MPLNNDTNGLTDMIKIANYENNYEKKKSEFSSGKLNFEGNVDKGNLLGDSLDLPKLMELWRFQYCFLDESIYYT